MPTSSLNKVLFLKRKLAESQESITMPLDNQRLKKELAAFNHRFEQFIAEMRANAIDEVLSTNETDQRARQLFLDSLDLNRGDHSKRRFLPTTLPEQSIPLSRSALADRLEAFVRDGCVNASSARTDRGEILKTAELSKHACIEDQISRLTKTFIETIEDENPSSALVEAYRKHGIYQMLYHNGVMGHYTTLSGKYDKEQNPPLGPIIMQSAMVGLGFATLSVAFFATVALLGLSGGWVIAATALFGSAIAYMGGLLYGILNDIFATKANLPYFLLGHQETQQSFFSSNDPLVQAIGWGVIATQPIAVIAALVFGIAIFATMMASASPVLTFMLPLMLVVVPLFAVYANAYAKRSADKYVTEGISLKMLQEDIEQKFRTALNLPADAEKFDLDQIDFDSPTFRSLVKELGLLNDYQLDGLALMSSSKKDKANWLANSDRNMLGYAVTPLLAITSLVLMLTLTSVPAVLFSPLLAIIIPVVSAAIAIALLATALTYVSVNKDKQVDNRYKLFTNLGNGEKKMDELHVADEQVSEASML